jgi:hypothetical protein
MMMIPANSVRDRPTYYPFAPYDTTTKPFSIDNMQFIFSAPAVPQPCLLI